MSIRDRLFGRVVGHTERGTFMSIEQSNLKTVQDALADIDGTIADAEKALRGLALDAALNPEGEAANQAAAAVVRLDGLKQRRRLLQEALTVAEENEQSRLDERSERDRKARARAFAQHLAGYERAVSTVAGIQQELQTAFSRAMQSATAANALLPHSLRWATEYLSADYLRQLMDVEAERIGRGEVASLSDPAKPPMRLREVEHPRTGAIPSLVELAGQHVANIKRAYDPRAFTPKPKPTLPIAPRVGEPAGNSGVLPAGNPSAIVAEERPVFARPPHTQPSPASGDLPKIHGEPEGDPNRPGSGPGIMPGGPILGVTVRVGGQIEERFAGSPQSPVQQHDPSAATHIADTPEQPPVAPQHESISGDTVIDDEPAPARALADILPATEEAIA